MKWILGLMAGLLLLSGCVVDTRALIIVDNQSECGEVAVRFTNTETNEVIRERVPKGTRREYAVTPNVFYEYIIDFTAAGQTADGFRCTLLDEGQVRVQTGQRQVFDLRTDKQGGPTATP